VNNEHAIPLHTLGDDRSALITICGDAFDSTLKEFAQSDWVADRKSSSHKALSERCAQVLGPLSAEVARFFKQMPMLVNEDGSVCGPGGFEMWLSAHIQEQVFVDAQQIIQNEDIGNGLTGPDGPQMMGY